jgi:hypothetical protein
MTFEGGVYAVPGESDGINSSAWQSSKQKGMESQRFHPESETDETGESQAVGGTEKVCTDGARTRRRCV